MPRVSVPPALRHPDFRWFGFGYLISAMGSELTQVAMVWQIYELTNSPLQVGLIGLARFVPLISMLLFGGMLADAVDRRRLLMATQIAQFSISAALAIITLSGAATPLVLFVGAAALSLCSALDLPTRNSIVPNLVPPQHLASGFALMNMQTKLGQVVGPSVGGVALLFGGPALCYAADAISWLGLLLALLMIRARTLQRPRPGAISMRSIGAGLAFVRAQPILLSIFILDLGTQLLGTNRALLPTFARDILRVGSPGLGLLLAATSAGAVLSGSLVSVLPPSRRIGRLVLAGLGVYGICSAVFALSREFWLSLAMMVGIGAGNGLSVILRGTITQLRAPDAMRGRVASVGNVFTGAGPRLGQLQTGIFAEIVGAPPAAFAGAIATLALVGVMTATSPLRNYEVKPEEPSPELLAAPGQAT